MQPFHGRKLPRAKKDAVKRKPFKASDISVLIAKAQADGDQSMADLITLAGYTGARIEELCSPKVEHLDNGIITIPGTKTKAAARQVPAHSAIHDLLVRLASEAKDGS